MACTINPCPTDLPRLKGMHITQSMSHRGNSWKFDTKAHTHYPRTKPNFEQEGNDSFGSIEDCNYHPKAYQPSI